MHRRFLSPKNPVLPTNPAPFSKRPYARRFLALSSTALLLALSTPMALAQISQGGGGKGGDSGVGGGDGGGGGGFGQGGTGGNPASGNGTAANGGGGGGDGGAGGAGWEIIVTSDTVTSQLYKGGDGDGGGYGINIGGGGGGGVGLFSSGSGALTIDKDVTGGRGGSAGNAGGGVGNIGSGGGGGVGLFSNGTGAVTVNAAVTGGNGGTNIGNVGGGGNGGGGLFSNGTGALTINAAVMGGNGAFGNVGGGGGAGLFSSGTGALTIDAGASIFGGKGGNGNGNIGGDGGTGLVLAGSNTTAVIAGSVSGGAKGTGSTAGLKGHAVEVTGTDNTLELHSGYSFGGTDVVATGANNLLALGGSTDGTFDVSDIKGAGNRDDTTTEYSGFGGYVKTGSSTWELTNTTTATTPWTITAGALAITSDGALGDTGGILTFNGGALKVTGAGFASTRDIVLNAGNGTVETDAATTLTLAGTISGTGSLTKNGAGTLTLSGTSSWSGGTTLNAGILQAGSATGLATGAYSLNGGTLDLNNFNLTMSSLNGTGGELALGSATLTLNASGDQVFGGAFTGSGTIEHQGTGSLTLSGNSSSFIGVTNIHQSALIVNGTLGGFTHLFSSSRLGGNGTFGDLSLHNGATIAPGNSIGTITVTGNLVLASGSTYEVEIDATGASDLITVSGTAAIQNALLNILPEAGVYAPGTTWTILTAAGGVTGQFSSITGFNLPYVDLVATYGANEVGLVALMKPGPGSGISFVLPGFTKNQTATAHGADSLNLGIANPLYNAIAGQVSREAAAFAFDQLSGEGHVSARTALLEDSRFVRDAAFERMAAAAREGNQLMRYNAWGKVYGSWGSFKGNGNTATLKRDIGGFFAGVDGYVYDNTLLGFYTGYSRSDFKANRRSSSLESDNIHLGLYAGTSFNGFNVRGGAAYTWHQIEANRSVYFPGFQDRLTSDYDASTAQVFGELSYRFDYKTSGLGNFALEPFAQLAYVSLDVDGFREKGGHAALRQFSSRSDATFTTLGLRASSDIAFGNSNLTFNALVGWRHAFGDKNPSANFMFASGNTPFTIDGVPLTRNAAVAEVGVDYKISESMRLSLNYTGQFGKDVRDNGIKAAFNWRF